MGLREGPLTDRVLMRLKDISTLVTILSLAWATFKGIDHVIQRFEKLESSVLVQDVAITKILRDEDKILENLNQLIYPERYGKRGNINRKKPDSEE